MKKIMAGMMSACIAFSPVITPALASEARVMSISENKEDTTATDMKNVLILVKNKISIPENLTEFSYRISYSGGNKSENKYWNFEWRDKEYKDSVNIRADESGNILSYSIYKANKGTPKPTYLKEELLEKATDFIEDIAPEISKSIVYKSSEFSGTYSGTYLYTFERIENGVRMPDNKVSVSVNYETGEVTSFSTNWVFGLEVPSSETKISIEEAREKIGKEVTMNLKYMNKTEEVDGKKKVKAYLVYVPDKSYMAVDAKTGEVYDSRDEYLSMDEYGANKNMLSMGAMSSDSAMKESMLTEEEISKIDELKGLISKEKAISFVTEKSDVLLLDDSAKAVTARLTQNYNYEEDKEGNYVWNLNFSDPREVDYNSDDTYRANINVSVDAKTGKILSFYSSVRNYYDSKTKEWEDVKVKYTSEECQKTFEEFVKGLEEEKFNNTKLANATDTAYILKYINENPVYGGYSYNYSRVNEGIEYTYNRISGKVDGVTGKIYSYNVNWTDDITFESPKDAMTPEEAYKTYAEKDGFNLVYEINNKHYIEENPKTEDYYDYSDLYLLEKEIRLVYRTDINPYYISPFTGEQLNYSGEVYEDVNEKEYTDISGFWGERDIRLITDMGYNFSGDEFLPNQLITKEELFELIRTVGSYSNEEEYKDLEKITKLDAMKIMIKNLGLEKIAKLSGIYNINFNDINNVASEDVGYIALSKGLGIVSGDNNNNCNPNKELSRIEAISMALKLASVR